MGTRKSTKSGSAKSAASSPARSPIRGSSKKSGAGGAGKKRLRLKPGSLFPADEKVEFYVAPSYVPPAAAPTLSRSNSKTASFAAKAKDDGSTTRADSTKAPASARGPGGDITAGKPTPRRVPSANAAFFPKEPIKARIRPKTSTAARRPGREPGAWNGRVGCEDLNDRLVKLTSKAYLEEPLTKHEQEILDKSPLRPGSSSVRTNTHHLTESGSQKKPQSARSVGASEAGGGLGPNLPAPNTPYRKIGLSGRKPFIAGPVCYGTNSKAVPIPRRPRTAGPRIAGQQQQRGTGDQRAVAFSEGETPTGGGGDAGDGKAGGRREEGNVGKQRRRKNALLERELRRDADDNIDHNHFSDRFQLGGWNFSTGLGEERTNYDKQLRYRSSAIADMALIEAGIKYAPPKPAWAMSAGQFNTTSNSPPPLGCY